MKLSLQQKEQFFHELREYVKSGRSIPDALELKAKMRSGPLQRVAERMCREGTGDTAVSYFAAVPEVFNSLDREIISAGEKGGLPERAFEFLRGYYETLARMRRGTIMRCIYPLLLLHVGAFLLSVPALFSSGVGSFLVQMLTFLGMFYLVGFLVWLVARTAVKAARVNPDFDGMLQTLPAIGGTRIALVGSRFCATMGMFVHAGAGILGSIDRSADASGSARFRRGADRAIDEVRNGGGVLSEAIAKTRAFPEEIDRAFAVGENSGRLDDEMERLASRYTEQFQERADASARWISGAIYACIAIALAVQILRWWFNYFGMIRSLL